MMKNKVFLIGRVVKDPTLDTTENGNKRVYATIAVPRSYKNEQGEFDTDFVDFVAWGKTAENYSDFCKKGDLIGVEARVETNTYETSDGEKKKSTQIVADNISYLSSVKEKTSDVEIDSDEDLDM